MKNVKLESQVNPKFVSGLFQLKVPFLPWKFSLNLMFHRMPTEWVHGYSSRTQKGRYVLFHDYDNLELIDILEELQALQELFKLSNYYVFKLDRENSYHAVCLDTFTLAEAYNIQKTTSCDLAFIHSIKWLRSKEWVLRWHKKGSRHAPIYDQTVNSKYGNKLKSTAHREFLKKLGVPVPMQGKWDKCKKIGLIDYNTANRINK